MSDCFFGILTLVIFLKICIDNGYHFLKRFCTFRDCDSFSQRMETQIHRMCLFLKFWKAQLSVIAMMRLTTSLWSLSQNDNIVTFLFISNKTIFELFINFGFIILWFFLIFFRLLFVWFISHYLGKSRCHLLEKSWPRRGFICLVLFLSVCICSF